MPTRDRNDAEFHRLHQEGLLVLPNAWDAGTARLMQSLGARAVATTSAGVAWAHGYADGDVLPLPALVATVTEIARAVSVPISVDMEGGYSSDPVVVGENVAAVVDAGGVGVNLEDSTSPADLLCAKIEHVKRAGAKRGVDVFVNARCDVYLRGLAPEGRRIEETLARAERYRAAGADGLFVPGVTAAADIEAIASSVRLPLNVLARPGLPRLAELATLGVRRLSAGSGITQAVYGRAATLAKSFLHDGASEPLVDGAMPYAEINALMAGALALSR
jgi:2-methylisocitrate lyase-like PEP mutase family enzyme